MGSDQRERGRGYDDTEACVRAVNASIAAIDRTLDVLEAEDRKLCDDLGAIRQAIDRQRAIRKELSVLR